MYDHIDGRDYPGREEEMSLLPSWLPRFVPANDEMKEYAYRARNVLRHIGYQSRGRPSGVHGLMHKCVA